MGRAPGTANKGIGCKCPAGHIEKRDAENTATCVTSVNYTQLFVDALKGDDLKKAVELALHIDGMTDKKAMAALAASFDPWLTNARDRSDANRKAGMCEAIRLRVETGRLYADIWGNVMQRAKNRSPATDPVEMATDQVWSKLAPLKRAFDGCIDDISKNTGDEHVAKALSSRRALDDCLESKRRFRHQVWSVRIVVDAYGTLMEWFDANKGRPKPNTPFVYEGCLHDLVKGAKYPSVPGGYAGTFTITLDHGGADLARGGVDIKPLGISVAEHSNNLPGLTVTEVFPRGIGASAGLQVGDRLISNAGGTAFSKPDDLTQVAVRKAKLVIAYVRDDQTLSVELALP